MFATKNTHNMINEIEKIKIKGGRISEKFYTGLLPKPQYLLRPFEILFLLVYLKLSCRCHDIVYLNSPVCYELTIFYFVISPRDSDYFQSPTVFLRVLSPTGKVCLDSGLLFADMLPKQMHVPIDV